MSFAHSSLAPIAVCRRGRALPDLVGLCRAPRPNSAASIRSPHKGRSRDVLTGAEWQAPPSGLGVPGHGHGSATLGPSQEWDAAKRHGGSKVPHPLLFGTVLMGGQIRISRKDALLSRAFYASNER